VALDGWAMTRRGCAGFSRRGVDLLPRCHAGERLRCPVGAVTKVETAEGVFRMRADEPDGENRGEHSTGRP